MSEHAWTQETLPALDAGLPPEDKERVERHLAECEACRAALAEQRRLDHSLDSLFAPVRPQPGLEDRLISNLRSARRHRPLWPWFAATAAVVLLGLLGAFLHHFDVELVLPGSEPVRMASNDAADQTYFGIFLMNAKNAAERNGPPSGLRLMHGTTHHGFNYRSHTSISGGIIGGKSLRGFRSATGVSDLEWQKEMVREDPFMTTDIDPSASELDTDINYKDAPKAAVSVPGLPDPKELPGIVGSNEAPPTSLPPPAGFGLGGHYHQPKGMPLAGSFFGKSGESREKEAIASPKKVPTVAKALGPIAKVEIDKEIEGQTVFAQQDPPAPTIQRKIIRTGEIDFEVNSFDTAVTEVTRLVAAVMGAFVHTTHSDKLPNGKTRGSIVVRMPPVGLDPFLQELRASLKKMGELRNQRIAAQDVSKQYTDAQSGLRAARAMEERLLQMIKTGKGEIKDLLAAERELGVWRTKIEEMEGQIRYYDNQVALSTLTIQLHEKEILASATIKVSERLQLGIEVEDVDKAEKLVLSAVDELKGRVVKAELKQQVNGQLEATLQVEVAADKSRELQGRLQQLGHVANRDLERVQQAEGGTGKPLDGKREVADVHFDISLYNVANIEPRETITLKLASADVPAAYRKLQDAVEEAKGVVRIGSFKEDNKLATSAVFHFDIPATQRAAIDKTIAQVGDIVTRSSEQVPPAKLATSRKVGYRLELQSVANIPPREKMAMDVEVQNVETNFRALAESVRNQKGTIAVAQLNKDKSGEVVGVLRFDVPLTARDALIREIQDIGIVRVQQSTRNPQVPDSPLATAQFQVTLASAGLIVPSDQSLGQQTRLGLTYAFRLLSMSLLFIFIGIVAVLPWALVGYVAYRVVRRLRAPQPG